MEEEAIKLPIIPELNVPATKKALKQMEDMMLAQVGKNLKIENEKMIDAQKKLYLGFAKVGKGKNQKYASFLYQKDSNGNLKDVPTFATYTSGEKKGQLRTLTPKQANAIYESNTLTQYKRALSDTTKKTSKRKNLLPPEPKKTNDKKTDKRISSFTRLLNTFKRVGFYRVARRAFQFIEQGFSQGLANIAKFSPDINKSLSGIVSQFTILSNSIASVLDPLLKIVEPILKSIVRVIANVAEVISYLIAKLMGSATYLKVNTEYFKDLNSAMNKFSFDKFESLGQSDDTSNMFETRDVSSGLSENTKSILDTIIAISGALLALGALNIIKWISGDGPFKFADSLGKINTKILDIGASVGFLVGVYEVIKTIKDLIDNWDSKSLADKIKGFCKMALYGIGAILIALSYIPALGIAFKIGGLTAIASAITLDAIGVFANGGIAEQGDLFIANERGPELVYSGPNNSSSIMNISQFKQATLEALFSWWETARYDIPESSSFYIDGEDIANSKRFISAMNRKNSGLNLK